MLTPALPTYIANETIPAGARVKFVAGSVVKVELADAGDQEIGTAILHSGQSSYAAGYGVTVNLVSNPGGRTLCADGAITEGNPVYRAANGRVSAAGPGEAIGIALETSTTDGDCIDGLLLPAAASGSAAAGTADGLSSLRVARATFDPSSTAGLRTIAAHGLGVTIPDDAIVIGGFIEVNTTFTSATDAATIAVSVEGANDIRAAVAISTGTSWDAGKQAIIPKANTPETTGVKLTAAREITATVAVEALTAGKFTIFLYYVVGA